MFLRFFENINLLKTRKLKKLRHAKSISYNSQYFSTGQSFLESGRNCAHNLFVRFWNFAPRTWGFPRKPEKPVFAVLNEDVANIAVYCVFKCLVYDQEKCPLTFMRFFDDGCVFLMVRCLRLMR